MIYNCRLCRRRLRDQNWCKHCEVDQFRAPFYPPLSKEKSDEIAAFTKDLITKAKANGYPKGKVS